MLAEGDWGFRRAILDDRFEEVIASGKGIRGHELIRKSAFRASLDLHQQVDEAIESRLQLAEVPVHWLAALGEEAGAGRRIWEFGVMSVAVMTLGLATKLHDGDYASTGSSMFRPPSLPRRRS